jgi:hypothetical protein
MRSRHFSDEIELMCCEMGDRLSEVVGYWEVRDGRLV